MEFDVEKCFTLFLETLELIVHHFFYLSIGTCHHVS